MKKLNKKGFTLIELLAVIVILLVIMTIAIPSITSSMDRTKEKQKNSIIEIIESSAEIYVDRHKNTIGSSSVISIQNLIDDGLLTKREIKDPFNSNRLLCGYITYSDNEYTFTESSSYCPVE